MAEQRSHPRQYTRSRSLLVLLTTALLLATVALTPRIFIYPLFRSKVETFLARQGVRLAPNHPPPNFTWSLLPPTFIITDIHLRVNNQSQEFPYPVEVHLDSIWYRVENTRVELNQHTYTTSSRTAYPFMVHFSSISWSNCTIVFHDPHPRPRLSILGGNIDLHALSLRQRTRELGSYLISRSENIIEESPTLLDVSIRKIGISTHSVTSIPVSVTHPTIIRLMNSFPTFFSHFFTPEMTTPDGQNLAHRIINPPHLSLIAPSLIFPALYQGISSFRQKVMENDRTKENGVETYHIPIPLSRSSVKIGFERRGTRRMHRMSLALVDENADHKGCTSIKVGHIDAIEISGRDQDGKGGCCTFQARNSGNYFPLKAREVISPLKTVNNSPANEWLM